MDTVHFQLISMIFSSCIFGVVYFGLIPIINKVWNLEIQYKDNKLTDTFVWIVGVVSCCAVAGIAYLSFSSMEIPLIIMTMIIMIALALITVSDYKKQLVANKVILLLLAMWVMIMVVYIILQADVAIRFLSHSLLGGLVAGMTFLLCYVVSKHQIGAGDVKIAFIMGLYLTSTRIVAGLFYGVFICCIYSIVQMCRKKMTMKSGLPLVPFLYLGTIVAYLLL